jgi:hypothetical protein
MAVGDAQDWYLGDLYHRNNTAIGSNGTEGRGYPVVVAAETAVSSPWVPTTKNALTATGGLIARP